MKINSPVPFEQRYDLRNQLWLDGPHGGWLALDRILGREVVVNLPYRAEDEQWFLQSAQLRARLRHANLVPLYDLGETKDGKPFFTDPYIQATDLRRLQRDGKDNADDVTLPRLVSYLLDVCKAVAFLHANGFLHLELHPGNVLVTRPFQEVFVIRGLPCTPPVSVEREVAGVKAISCGAPPYMAPEQADPVRLGISDVLTDVYGLGGVLFEILYDNPPNGAHPLSISEMMTALVARQGPPTPGTFGIRAARCPELARELEPVCLRALESDRTARQVSVSALATEIEQFAWGWAG